MKSIIRALGLTAIIVCTTNITAQTTKESSCKIQEKVKRQFTEALEKSNPSTLLKLNEELESQYAKHNHNILKYWYAYSEYYTAIYYIKQDNKTESEKHIETAIENIEQLENKTSEDYALLAILQNFSIQFKNTIQKISLVKQVQKNGQLALKKDTDNIRAYYALASLDFYTPKEYGGGKHVEEYLLKAISLPEQKIKNDFLPSWGKKQSYILLIMWYKRNEEWSKVRKTYTEVIAKYPNDPMIKEIGNQIKNNQ